MQLLEYQGMLKFHSGFSYRVRFASAVTCFGRLYTDRCTAITDYPGSLSITPRYQLTARARYAVHVFLRSSPGVYLAGKHYILEFPGDVFRQICSIAAVRKTPPGGEHGWDVEICVAGRGLHISFAVSAVEDTSLTTAEKCYAQTGFCDLKAVFRGSTRKELIKILELDELAAASW